MSAVGSARGHAVGAAQISGRVYLRLVLLGALIESPAAFVAAGFLGAVLGQEAPLIALGSVVGLAVTPFLRLDPREHAVLATAGSFSAISALFGGPIVGGC